MHRYIHGSHIFLFMLITTQTVRAMQTSVLEQSDNYVGKLFDYVACGKDAPSPELDMVGSKKTNFKEFQTTMFKKEMAEFLPLEQLPQKKSLRQRLATKKLLLNWANVTVGTMFLLYAYTHDSMKHVAHPLSLGYLGTSAYSATIVLRDLFFFNTHIDAIVLANQHKEHGNIRSIKEGVTQLKIGATVMAAAQLAHLATAETTNVTVKEISGKLDAARVQLAAIQDSLQGVAQQEELQRLTGDVANLSQQLSLFKEEIITELRRSIQEELAKALMIALAKPRAITEASGIPVIKSKQFMGLSSLLASTPRLPQELGYSPLVK